MLMNLQSAVFWEDNTLVVGGKNLFMETWGLWRGWGRGVRVEFLGINKTPNEIIAFRAHTVMSFPVN